MSSSAIILETSAITEYFLEGYAGPFSRGLRQLLVLQMRSRFWLHVNLLSPVFLNFSEVVEGHI